MCLHQVEPCAVCLKLVIIEQFIANLKPKREGSTNGTTNIILSQKFRVQLGPGIGNNFTSPNLSWCRAFSIDPEVANQQLIIHACV